ncbi:TIGR01777 family oxidoreductase [Lutibacter sp. A80]|uniref:TIGR01777 family oxidoreductase n=1 Tax=Lutibacter sp. A80 TaxID=2918453 RepID=UPI001F06ED3F|nr:TIGR01777 family oxidoreductase [Lutibacter sp. A80]UMB60505.1 TIGR01777 family oxidoreductase [Lutibacter sp. A80]
MASILITGGSGLIGSYLSNLLKSKGHSVSILSRKKSSDPSIFYWDITNNYIDPEAIISAEYIIHLAGAGIADKRWTSARKKNLIDSRVKSTNLIYNKVKELNPNLKGFISASGIGFYGAITSEKIYNENDAPYNDFLSKVCVLWEKSALQFNSLNIRTVILRTGIVLSKEGGALKKIIKPIKLGFGAALGSGKQYMPWIAMEDLCNMYVSSIENTNFKGVYNAASPEHITNNELTKLSAKILKKPLWLPNAPSFILKILLGELAVILLEGSRVSSEKVKNIGFKFEYTSLEKYLNKILN